MLFKSDRCRNPACPNPGAMEGRVPCLFCFGMATYCCEECAWADYHEHQVECSLVQRRAIRSGNPQKARQKQVTTKGFQTLVTFVIKSESEEKLKESVFFIRLPADPQERLTRDHPVKRVARNGMAHKMRGSLAMTETLRRLLQHQITTRDHPHPYIYFVAYPPDMSFAFFVSFPYDEKADVPPHAELIPCPCELHKGRTQESSGALQTGQ